MIQYPQLPGFETGSDTSQAAALSMISSAASLRYQALHLLRHAPDGLTSDELELLTGWPHQTASARLRELVLTGHAYDSRDRRRTSHGRMAVVRRARTGER